jgi:DNA-binding NtrC family response regulator
VREESALIAAKPGTRPSALSAGGPGPTESSEGREVLDLFVEYLCREQPILLKDLMDRIERDIILRSLRMADGNQKQAAGILGVKYTTLHEKLKKFGIRPPKTQTPLAF